MEPELSVVLCTYNRAARLPAALEALMRQSTNLDYEVIVIDNNSTDATGRVAAPHRRRRTRHEPTIVAEADVTPDRMTKASRERCAK
jgi:glycosyltransferase involved in cell wall biosynthesis